jgi:hypothetical protein
MGEAGLDCRLGSVPVKDKLVNEFRLFFGIDCHQ